MTQTLWDGIEGIVLDAVGTLIEPRPGVAEVYRAAAFRQGVALDCDEVRARFGLHFRNDEVDEARGPLVTDEEIEARRWRRIVAAVLPEVPEPGRAFEELWGHFARPEAWRCCADVTAALEAFRAAGYPLRIGSNFDARLRAVVRGLAPLASLEAGLVISSEVGYRKPHERFYRAACASLGLAPGRVLCVGDDPENDLEGPRRAGLKAALIAAEGSPPNVFRTLGELAAGLPKGPR